MTLPLLLIPGLMNDARVWQHQVAAWSNDREVHVADSSTHDSIAGIAGAALARGPAGRFALAGFSLGGYVALEIVRQAPERVAALALVDTGSRADTPDATALRRRMIAAVDAGSANFDPVVASFLPRVVHPSRTGDVALTDLLVAMAQSVGIAGFVRQQCAAIGRVDSRSTLLDIGCPTVVVCGRDDQVTPLELSDEMASSIPGARLVVIEQCGHMAPLERPDEVTEALADWANAR